MSKQATQSRKTVELSLLFEIGQHLDRSLDLQEFIKPVLETMDHATGLSCSSLALLNRETDKVTIEASHGTSVVDGKELDSELPSQVIAANTPGIMIEGCDTPILFDNGSEDLRDPSAIESYSKTNHNLDRATRICVPIKLANEAIGALEAERQSESGSCDKDLRLLATIASMIAQAVKLRQTALEERGRLLAENTRLQEALRSRFRPKNIIGTAKAMRVVYDLIARLAKSGSTVLILGESGVGKELIAQAIHYNSDRANNPLVTVNSAAIPQTLLESELFGHEVGAFTGALRQRKGRFEQANTGTLFLDEVGDLSPAIV